MESARILVVEDEQIVAASLRLRLEEMGYSVLAMVSSAEKAIDQAASARPDLVLMDIRLDGNMDGIEAATQIRSRFRIPVVYLTAYSNSDVLDRAKVTEPYGYILKPFEDRELHVVVEMALYKHRMEQVSREREQWSAAVLKSIGDGVTTTNVQGQITFMNSVAEGLTGWTLAEAVGHDLEEVFTVIDEDTEQPVGNPLRQAMQKRAPVPLENHALLIGKDLHKTPIEDCAAPISDEAGLLLGGVVVFRDVTERRLARQKELEAQRFAQEVLDSMPARIAVLDAGGHVIALNRAWDQYGQEREGASRGGLGIHFVDLCAAAGLQGKQAQEAATGIQAVLSGKSQNYFIEYSIPRSHSERWYLWTVVPFHDGHGRVITLHIEITDRKRAEDAIMQLAGIVESSQDAIICKSPDGVILSWNSGAERLYGYTAAEIVGESIDVLFPPEQQAELETNRARLKRGERIKPYETVRRRKDGSHVDVMISFSPVCNVRGEVVAVSAIAQDITHLKELEAKIRQAQKMEVVGRLAGGVAHDFNNLLTVINGYSQVLLATLSASESKARDLVGEIYGAGQRAASLTRQLVAYSRKQVLQVDVHDLNVLIENARKILGRVIGEDIELQFNLAADECLVEVDPTQIDQILMNICINARDAMPTGGKITVETRNVELDDCFSSGLFEVRPGPYALIAITDTGCGIDKETQAHIFEPFYTTKEPGKGTGLGLAMVYGTVKQSGGYIKVYSEVGSGATFRVYLPSAPKDRAERKPVPPPPSSFGGTETILLVEDDQAVRALTEHLLRQSGYEVLSVPGALEALQKASHFRGKIDLLLTDVVMPRMGGHDLSQALRRLFPDLRVLFMSGYTNDAVIRHGVLGSETHFIEKPFTLANLLKKVREAIEART